MELAQSDAELLGLSTKIGPVGRQPRGLFFFRLLKLVILHETLSYAPAPISKAGAARPHFLGLNLRYLSPRYPSVRALSCLPFLWFWILLGDGPQGPAPWEGLQDGDPAQDPLFCIPRFTKKVYSVSPPKSRLAGRLKSAQRGATTWLRRPCSLIKPCTSVCFLEARSYSGLGLRDCARSEVSAIDNTIKPKVNVQESIENAKVYCKQNPASFVSLRDYSGDVYNQTCADFAAEQHAADPAYKVGSD